MSLCPRCQKPLIQVEENQVVAQTCPACRGTWISLHALERRTRIETNPNLPHTPLPPVTELAETVARSNSTTPLACPVCRETMTKTRFLPTIPIQIDRCSRCAHIWLDAGEQGLLLRLYTELLATHPDLAAQRQPHLDTLTTAQSLPTPYTHTDAANIAWNIASALCYILIDILLTPSGYHRNRWW
ncbi:MAG TPA: zf-TFIIB domain-containing protein [Phycisphaerae bacterium]|nr:zf-TFIIB domain-containing protein [Phycisphaerae bacterium]